MNKMFAVSTPGIEALIAQELQGLGMAGVDLQPGGVAFEGELEDLYRANLHLRTASRVLVRLGEFYAAAFSELRKKAGRLPWESYLSPGQPVALHVTCHKSRLYHSDAVAERIAGSIGDRLGRPAPLMKLEEDESGRPEHSDGPPPQLVVARLVKDQCTISIDSSGALLHRRGYRLATAKAPLRETLAAAMLLACGWAIPASGAPISEAPPLLDPFCGSGTIPIEAALLARRLPPGRGRRFAFMDWPRYEPARWQAVLSTCPPPRPDSEMPPIQASDRDAGAVQMAQENAKRAGVFEDIQFSCRAVSAIEPPGRPGWVVTNPPYGLRVSAGKDLRNLYAQLGNVLRLNCPGWHAAILCSDLKLLSQTRLRLEPALSFSNGGVKVRLYTGKVEMINHKGR